MGTQLREKIFSPLDPKAASALVDEVNELMDSFVESESDEDDGERDEDGYLASDVFDDVFLEAEDSPPPLVAEVRAAAQASGGTSELEPAALERLPSCRSTLVLEYFGRIAEKAPFVALEKLLFERAGAAVVSSAEGTLRTVETTVAKRAKEIGPVWSKTLPLGKSEAPKKAVPIPTRPAKEGEADATSVHKRLSGIIEGRDPLAREMLKRELTQTTDAVRAYAGALMHEGPTPDAAIAKVLSCSVPDVIASREDLKALLKKIR